MKFLPVFFLLLLMQNTATAEDQATSTLKIFRWNQGYKAENTPLFHLNVTESEYQAFLQNQQLPTGKAQQLFTGCYVSFLERGGQNRKIASTNVILPKSEMHRVCVPAQKLTE